MQGAGRPTGLARPRGRLLGLRHERLRTLTYPPGPVRIDRRGRQLVLTPVLGRGLVLHVPRKPLLQEAQLLRIAVLGCVRSGDRPLRRPGIMHPERGAAGKFRVGNTPVETQRPVLLLDLVHLEPGYQLGEGVGETHHDRIPSRSAIDPTPPAVWDAFKDPFQSFPVLTGVGGHVDSIYDTRRLQRYLTECLEAGSERLFGETPVHCRVGERYDLGAGREKTRLLEFRQRTGHGREISHTLELFRYGPEMHSGQTVVRKPERGTDPRTDDETLRAGMANLQTMWFVRADKRIVAGLLAFILVVGAAWAWRTLMVSDAETSLTADRNAPLVDSASLNGSWSITSGIAGYRVDEVLFGRDVTVTGRTDDIAGTLTAEDLTLTGEVIVKLADVTSDSDKRDSQFRGRIMKVERYPEARLAFSDTAEDLGDGRYRTKGDLSIKDATREVAVEFAVTGDGDTIQVTGNVPLLVSDWPIDPPSIPGITVEDSLLLEFQAVLNRDR